MKKIFIYSCLLISLTGFCQNSSTNTECDLVRKYENLKSGNYKDIFSSFFQLATENFDPTEKSLKFNSTLFSIKAKADPELLKDVNIRDARFSRNFQFNVKLDFDGDYKYQGFTGGFTLAIINGRDRSLAVLTDTKYGDLHLAFQKMLNRIQTEIMEEIDNNSALNGTQKQKAKDDVEEEIERLKLGNEPNSNSIYNQIITKYDKKKPQLTGFGDKDVNFALRSISLEAF